VSRATAKARGLQLGLGERRVLLIAGDLLAAVLALAIALALWARVDYLGPIPTAEFIRDRAGWFVALPLLWPLLMVNLYDAHRAASWRETLGGVLVAAASGLIIYAIIYFTLEGSLVRRGVLYFLSISVLFTLLWRGAYLLIFTAPGFLRRVVIVGAGVSGAALVQAIRGLSQPPFNLVGLVDDDPAKQGREIAGVRVLGDNSHLSAILDEQGISDVIVAITGALNGAMFQALLDAQQRGVQITRMPVIYETLLGRVPIRYLESDWLLRSFVDELHVSSAYLLAKRLMDVLGAVLGLSLLAIVLPWVSLIILVESGRPIFLRQRRLGQGGRPFDVLKLRTMRQDAEADGQAHWAQHGDPRTTRVGRLLRRTHIDEFPQFWNVLVGEMSLVGPRPERPGLVAELEKQIPFYRARLLVKPGIGGWAQVNYGKGASVEGSAEKLEYDLYYIQHRSLLMDVWILLRTAGAIFGLRGV
jgi:exopolysaccharide biosynthesis polyprenyl glycosylphosphotransferase